MVSGRSRCNICVLQPDIPLVVIRIGAAQPVGQERVEERVGGEDWQVRQGIGGDVATVRNSVGKLAGGRDVD